MAFNLKDYEEVKDRIPRFWEKHGDGAIVTALEGHDGQEYIFKASLINGSGQVIATGWASEIVGSSPVNKTSALENCETSAIGRALANAGFASGSNRPSREEMSKAAGRGGEPATTGTGAAAPAASPPASTDATKRQVAKINYLVDQKGMIPDPKQWPNHWPLPEKLSKSTASNIIDWLDALPIEEPAERVASIKANLGAVEDEFSDAPF